MVYQLPPKISVDHHWVLILQVLPHSFCFTQNIWGSYLLPWNFFFVVAFNLHSNNAGLIDNVLDVVSISANHFGCKSTNENITLPIDVMTQHAYNDEFRSHIQSPTVIQFQWLWQHLSKHSQVCLGNVIRNFCYTQVQCYTTIGQLSQSTIMNINSSYANMLPHQKAILNQINYYKSTETIQHQCWRKKNDVVNRYYTDLLTQHSTHEFSNFLISEAGDQKGAI